MSGSFPDANEAYKAADIAAAVASIVDVLGRTGSRQAQAAAFITEHGADVIHGHTTVGTVPAILGGSAVGGTPGEVPTSVGGE